MIVETSILYNKLFLTKYYRVIIPDTDALPELLVTQTPLWVTLTPLDDELLELFPPLELELLLPPEVFPPDEFMIQFRNIV